MSTPYVGSYKIHSNPDSCTPSTYRIPVLCPLLLSRKQVASPHLIALLGNYIVCLSVSCFFPSVLFVFLSDFFTDFAHSPAEQRWFVVQRLLLVSTHVNRDDVSGEFFFSFKTTFCYVLLHLCDQLFSAFLENLSWNSTWIYFFSSH